MMITYGHHVASAQDRFVVIAEAVRENAAKRPGLEIVDVFPIREYSFAAIARAEILQPADRVSTLVRYLPTWFPFFDFHEYARMNREMAEKMRSLPYEMVKEHMVRRADCCPSCEACSHFVKRPRGRQCPA